MSKITFLNLRYVQYHEHTHDIIARLMNLVYKPNNINYYINNIPNIV